MRVGLLFAVAATAACGGPRGSMDRFVFGIGVWNEANVEGDLRRALAGLQMQARDIDCMVAEAQDSPQWPTDQAVRVSVPRPSVPALALSAEQLNAFADVCDVDFSVMRQPD